MSCFSYTHRCLLASVRAALTHIENASPAPLRGVPPWYVAFAHYTLPVPVAPVLCEAAPARAAGELEGLRRPWVLRIPYADAPQPPASISQGTLWHNSAPAIPSTWP